MTVPRGRMEEEVKDAVQQLRQSHAMASADVARNADLEWCSFPHIFKKFFAGVISNKK